MIWAIDIMSLYFISTCYTELKCEGALSTVLCKKNATKFQYFLRLLGVQSSTNFRKVYCFNQNGNSGFSSHDQAKIHAKYR